LLPAAFAAAIARLLAAVARLLAAVACLLLKLLLLLWVDFMLLLLKLVGIKNSLQEIWFVHDHQLVLVCFATSYS